MPTARTRANRKYNEKAYSRFQLSVPKCERAAIDEAVKNSGLSRNAFIISAVKAKIKAFADISKIS